MPRKSAAALAADDAMISASSTRLIALSDLYLHPLNPRQEPPAAEIEALAASIDAVGLLQNLSGFADNQIRFRLGHHDTNPAHIGIVAGGRRLRALQLLAARGDWAAAVPVQVTEDLELATQWAGAENETQRGLSVPDRIAAYAQMRDRGHSVEAIASTFAHPIGTVRQLLALATLPDRALDALRADRITLDIAKALTTARDETIQTMALDAALDGKSGWDVKAMLRQGSVNSTDRRARFVGLAAYHGAGGTSTLDLFADQSILHDEGILDALAQEQGKTLTEEVQQAEGWAWSIFAAEQSWQITQNMRRIYGKTEPLPEGDQARLDELEELDEDTLTEAQLAELGDLVNRRDQLHYTDAERATAGIIGSLNGQGELIIERAYLRQGDSIRPAAGDDSIDVGPAAPEASMPQNLKDDLRRIRLIVLQDALRRDETLCYDLLALQLARKLQAWVQPFALDQTHATPPEKRDGTTIPAALADPGYDSQTTPLAATLTAWLDQPEDAIDSAFFNGLARAFCRWDGAIVNHIVARAAMLGRPINARTLWQPTLAGFLNRVSAGYLDSLWRDLVPDEGSRHAGFASLSKKDKAKELDRLFSDWGYREAMGLDRATNDRIDAWLPEELRFNAPTEEGDAE